MQVPFSFALGLLSLYNYKSNASSPIIAFIGIERALEVQRECGLANDVHTKERCLKCHPEEHILPS